MSQKNKQHVVGIKEVIESAKDFCDDISGNDGLDVRQIGYLKSYRYYVDHFDETKQFSPHDVVIGAGFSYSWMATILRWKKIEDVDSLKRAADVLTAAKKIKTTQSLVNKIDGCAFNVSDLVDVVAGSYVGSSKLLHFVNPKVFPIYDSNICKYMFGFDHYSKVNQRDEYFRYIKKVSILIKGPKFGKEVYSPINTVLTKKGFGKVSRVRALEMAIFNHQRKIKKNNKAKAGEAKKN